MIVLFQCFCYTFCSCHIFCFYSNIVLVQVYIRPCLEYGFPLFDAHVKSGGGKQFLVPLQKSLNSCVNWIGGGRANRPTLTANLCGLLDVRERLKHLRASFQHHLYMMDPANPLQVLFDSFGHSTPKKQLTTHLRWDELHTQFLSATVFTPTGYNISGLKPLLQKYLSEEKRKWIVAKNDKTAPLIAIIDEDARIPELDCDGVLGTFFFFYHLINIIDSLVMFSNL